MNSKIYLITHIKDYGKELINKKYVTHLGPIIDPSRFRYISRSHYLINLTTSKNETYGRINVEAMACGTIPIVSDLEVFEYIEDGVNGIRIPLDKLHNLEFIIKKINKFSKNYEQMRKNAIKTAEQYSDKQFIKQLSRYARSLMDLNSNSSFINPSITPNKYNNTFPFVKNKPSFVKEIPTALTIETGAFCQLKCPLCIQSDPKKIDFKRSFLTLKDFKKIILLFNGHIKRVDLYNWGEPLLNPEIERIVSYASSKNIHTTMHSNLNDLTPKLAKKLILGGLGELAAAIDGASEESYQTYRKGGSLTKALSNLKLLIDLKRKLGSKNVIFFVKPYIYWKFLIFRHNQGEIENAKKIAKEIDVPIKFELAYKPDKFSPNIKEFNNNNFKNKIISRHGLICDQLWGQPTINSDGGVFPCCIVDSKKYEVGNIFKQDFKDIWNNDKYTKLRRLVQGEYSDVDNEFFCNSCIFGPNHASIPNLYTERTKKWIKNSSKTSTEKYMIVKSPSVKEVLDQGTQKI